jgi:ribonucleotide monophosphatase NagD (HAD superfamily)
VIAAAVDELPEAVADGVSGYCVAPTLPLAEYAALGGAYGGFDYPTMNRVFRMLMDGAELVAMHRNLYWLTSEGWQLDGGAYVAGLEESGGRRCVRQAVRLLPASKGARLPTRDDGGDDIRTTQRAIRRLTGVLVRTGKFRRRPDRGRRPDEVSGFGADLSTLPPPS